MAGFYYNWGKTDSAEVMAKKVRVCLPNSLSHLVLGEVYYQKQMFDSASFYLQKVISGNSLYHRRTAYQLLHRMAEKQKQYQKASQYASLCIHAIDSIFLITQTEEVNKIHSLYNYNLSERENQRLQSKTKQQQLLLFRLLFAASILIGVVLYLLYRLREHRRNHAIREQHLRQISEEQEARSNRRIMENEQQIALLTEQLEAAKLENDTFKHAMLEAQAKALGATNEQIRAIQNEQEMRLLAFRHSDVYLHFHHAAKSSELKKDDWKLLSEALDTAFPNFQRRLYALYPKLSEQELRICYLIKTDLKRTVIAELLSRSVSAITNSLSRLYEKVPMTYGAILGWSHKGWHTEIGTNNPFTRHCHYREYVNLDIYQYNQVQTGRINQQTGYIKVAYTLDFGRKTSREKNDVNKNINSAIIKSY